MTKTWKNFTAEQFLFYSFDPKFQLLIPRPP